MCKPTNVSAADNFADLLFGTSASDVEKETTVVPEPKVKKAKKSSKAKIQVEGDKVIAERFRTKQCKNYLEKGNCPYESRCMFAHGDHELRTAKQNLQDGLVSEEAIRQFKKMMTLKLRARQAEMRHQNRAATALHIREQLCSPSHRSDSNGPSETSSSCDEISCSPRVYVGDAYYHNPYGWQALASPVETSVQAFPVASY